MTEQLDPITLGLGAVYGYSGSDLTNLRSALPDEVPYTPVGEREQVLELRIHGVGGAPATDNLETPAVLQVAGDGAAGFFRAWYPGGSAKGRPKREAYCWGQLNYQAWWSALWLMLLPFGLINVAHWALPNARATGLRAWSRGLLRLLALALTTCYIATTEYLFVDLIAWQASQRHNLWSWLNWYTELSFGVRIAIAQLIVFGVIVVLWRLSLRAQGKYESVGSGFGAPDDPQWALSSKSFWCGERPVVRQRAGHLVVSAAAVLYVEVLPGASSNTGLRTALIVTAGVLAAIAALIVAGPWSDRVTSAGPHAGDSIGLWMRCVAYVSLLFAAAVVVARVWWQPVHVGVPAVPSDTTLQVTLVFGCLGLALALAVTVILQRPWTQKDVMGKGLASVAVTLLATLVSAIFGAILLLTVANLLAKPTSAKVSTVGNASKNNLMVLPTTVYASGLAFLIAVASAVGMAIIVAGFERQRIAKRLRTGTGPGELSAVYAGRGAQPPLDADARKTVAGTWATSKLTDYAAAALFGITVPTLLALVAYEAILIANKRPSWLATAATVGTSLGVLATGAFVAYLRSALLNTTARKRFGFFWDVVTFWPRACHPFGPPSYAERSIPEVVTRIRRLTGDIARGDDDPAAALQAAEALTPPDVPYREAHSPVLLVGYSQGCPIAVAVVAQLPNEVRERVALLTLAAPVRRLYGRAFPAYFGTAQLELLRDKLTSADRTVRWRNVIRRSDYIGGWALDADYSATSAVDREIYDPPVLWTNADPAPPPTHLHSDWFPDPQTRPHADEMAATLCPPARPAVTKVEDGDKTKFLTKH
ncbi:MAG TPA: hypothetical protein VFE19_12030 [Jatrophihabitantaceae bacterium]|nr:hypothetical protein [Jatrophihabitantaceae bacterium]